ncbi:hypothetical protein ABW20_dc0107353 [Dactylellina cionopaga]|nr:hypothetical protein ABW20_dc0107353 [Dactylellina cionopaga]
MSLFRPSKPLKLLSLIVLLHFPAHTTAQIAGFFPEYLKSCIDRCQPLWSANYDCTLQGQSNLDCLCQSQWVEQFYEGSTCTCTSDFESQEFRNWFDGTGGCSPYVEARIRSSETSRPTSTTSEDRSSTEVESTTTEDRSSSTRTRPTSTTAESTTTSSGETKNTTNGSTFTTVPSQTTGTRGDQTATTTGPSIATTVPQDSGFITDQNKRWVIPTITVGGLIVVGAAVFAVLFFCFGCCRRSGKGRYSKANNPGGEAAGLVAGMGMKNKKKKRMWLSSVPFFGGAKSGSSQTSSSQDMTLVGDHEGIDTGYYGAGGYPPYFNGNANYVPYQHGAPLPPIDEVQSIAESTMTGHRDRGLGGMPMSITDRGMSPDDEGFSFGYENQQGVSPYTPVDSRSGDWRDSVMLPPAPVAQANMPLLGPGGPEGAGLIGAAISHGGRGREGDPMNFSNRYEDLTTRRMERRMFDPVGAPGSGMVMMIPRKEVGSSNPSTPVGGMPQDPARSHTVSPPISTVSSLSAYSSGFGGGGGSLAGRGTSSGRGDGGAFSGFPRAPAPAGSGLFSPGRGDYYEDYR